MSQGFKALSILLIVCGLSMAVFANQKDQLIELFKTNPSTEEANIAVEGVTSEDAAEVLLAVCCESELERGAIIALLWQVHKEDLIKNFSALPEKINPMVKKEIKNRLNPEGFKSRMGSKLRNLVSPVKSKGKKEAAQDDSEASETVKIGRASEKPHRKSVRLISENTGSYLKWFGACAFIAGLGYCFYAQQKSKPASK